MTHRNSTRPDRRRLVRAAARFFAPCLLACLLSGAAAAYTVVMRGGRRVEIPGAFTLTHSALTYEAASGLSVTLPLDHIDVEATERANDETAGSFLRRAQGTNGHGAVLQTTPDAVPARSPLRTVTNRDLENARRARVASESDYERRRKELGLPSAEEMRRHHEREEAYMRELARQKSEQDAAAERYRRALSDELQTEILLLEAEDYHDRRLSAGGFGNSSGYFSSDLLTFVVNGRPFYGRRFSPSHRASSFKTSRHAGFGAFGVTRGPRVRHGVGVSLDVGGGTRAVGGFRRRGFQGQPAGRR